MLFADLGKASGCSQNTSMIHSLIHWFIDPVVKVSLQRRQAQMVLIDAFSHKTNYIDIFWEILNPYGY